MESRHFYIISHKREHNISKILLHFNPRKTLLLSLKIITPSPILRSTRLLFKAYSLNNLLIHKILSPKLVCNSIFSGFAFLAMSSSSNKKPTLEVKLLSENATMPKRGSPFSAGFDLASAENTVIKAGERGIVKTDLSIACPPGTYGRIAPRSGLAVKNFIDVGAGVVGEVRWVRSGR